MATREVVAKKYKVSYLEGQSSALLYDLNRGTSSYLRDLQPVESMPRLKLGDTITILFNKGLLGVNRDPKALDNRVELP